jgi:hypothetical protein
MSDNGWWAVVETGQGGGLPDTLHGPYWDEEEAQGVADDLGLSAAEVGRRDRYDVVRLETVDER